MKLKLGILMATALLGFGLWAGGFAGLVLAETPINLTGDIKARLAAAPNLGKTPDAREMFNGKPVLVTFFASW